VTTLKEKLRLIGSTLVLILFAHDVQSAAVLDGFTDVQYAENGIQYSDRNHTNQISDLSITNTVLGHAKRILTATAAPNEFTDISVNKGKLSISNSGFGDASVLYSFDTIDLAAFAKAIAINISFIDLNVEIQLIANDDSVFAFHDFGGAGRYLVDFSQFSDPSEFTHLHSLELQFRGPEAWDAKFTQLAAVPEPSVTALFLIGLMALGISVRREVATA